ncbi:MAG: MFS transporter [Erysipelotrichaceae bacterium]|jgi:MFS family permease|nr:MFS transporter [Erysipelotrichaceae bacterium]
MSKNKPVVTFVLFYVISYIAYSFTVTQQVSFLTDLGYNTSERSLILAFMAAVVILFQILLGYLSDRYATVKRFVLLGLAGYAISAFFNYNMVSRNLLLHLLLFGLTGGFYMTCYDSSDTWLMETGKDTSRYYSLIRGMGSVGWAIGSLITAAIISRFQYGGIGYATLLCVGILLLLSNSIPDAIKNKNSASKLNLGNIREIFASKKYTLTLLVFFLIFCINALNTVTIVDKMNNLGATNGDLGMKWAIQAVVELPVFFGGVWLSKYLSMYLMAAIAAVFYVIEFFLFFIVQDVGVLVWLSLFQMITFPLMLLSAKNLFFDLSPAHLKSTGQMVAFSVANGLTALLIPLYHSLITTRFGVDITLLSGVFFGIAALVLLPFAAKSKERNV